MADEPSARPMDKKGLLNDGLMPGGVIAAIRPRPCGFELIFSENESGIATTGQQESER
jgi:hypothetical protein